MATAPRPGAQRRKQESAKAFSISIDGVKAVVRPGDFGPRDEVIVRMATKKPFNETEPTRGGLGYELSLQGLIAQMGDEATVGSDTLAVLWWFGRYKAGENVTLGQVVFDEFPSLAELNDDRLTLEEIIEDDDGDNSPEG